MLRKILAITLAVLLLNGCNAAGDAGRAIRDGARAIETGIQDVIPHADKTISPEQAQKIALKHAGLTAEQVTRLRVEPDVDDGTSLYEVQFMYNGREYDYEIDAHSGAILSCDQTD